MASHGGHLTELLELGEAFGGHDVFYCTYQSGLPRSLERVYLFKNLTERPLRIIPMVPRVLAVLLQERPDVIVSTGSEIAIPFFVLGKLLGIRTVFIESVCRVRTASFTGRLLYHFSDAFFVQWESLCERYGPHARFAGGLL